MTGMEIVINLLGLLAIIGVALAGIAGTGVLAARGLRNSLEGENVTKNHIAERKNNHERTE